VVILNFMIAQITPPYGLILFVLSALTGVPMRYSHCTRPALSTALSDVSSCPKNARDAAIIEELEDQLRFYQQRFKDLTRKLEELIVPFAEAVDRLGTTAARL